MSDTTTGSPVTLPVLKAPGMISIGGAPEGFDALVLAALVRGAAADGETAGRPHLHIARDEGRLVALKEALAFAGPDIEVLDFPAWDCVPYDRVSPHGEIVARRIETLAHLHAVKEAGQGSDGQRPLLVVTTVSAALQRVPPESLFKGAVFTRPGDKLDREELIAYLTANGYVRAGTVREPGEFAVRGGLIDLYPPGKEEPLRIDMFGEVIEDIRTFDAMTQRTTGETDHLDLKPVSEAPLDEESVRRFRTSYRDLFGAGGGADPLYESVSNGLRIAGMEHWLPLFHEKLETLFDYLPASAVTLDNQVAEAAAARLEVIADYYEARTALMDVSAKASSLDDTMVYKPLAPERLYLTARDWENVLAGRPVGQLSPFTPAEGDENACDAGGRGGRDFSAERSRPDTDLLDALGDAIGEAHQGGRKVILTAYSDGSRERLATLMADHGIEGAARISCLSEMTRKGGEGEGGPRTGIAVLSLERGFSAPGYLFLSEQDIFGERQSRKTGKQRRGEDIIAEAASLTEGDLVVHMDHGVGRYDGLETLPVSGAPHDCLALTYLGGDRLYVPVENIEVLSRYGSEGSGQLDKLGGVAWQARKARVKNRIKDIAAELIKIAAERALRDGDRLNVEPGLFNEFCARFPYAETEDQIRAIDDTIDDLAAGKPMDRLVCGDVGFGKTEVALRAAFAAALSGVQVAIVTPTTLLCRQHHETFKERFKGFPVRIAQLSRLTKPKEAKEVKEGLANGSVDIVIGTHALLGKSIKFANLGLVIVDEEQHFGVKQKEALKKLRADVHILTLTATPIPRTLQLALTGVRELSLIASPPVDRLAVRTFVLPFDPVIIREAILRERYRGGQTFYVCPRIEDLAKVDERLKELVPEVKVVIAHGQMASADLENVINDFYDGKFDVLLSTSIIESGLDIPSANTLIVHRADMFGLSQLYQIRGRVGRAKMRAYAYLTLPPGRLLSAAATKRLEVLHNLDTLGAGFTLASHDLDIRGAGNLLGSEQSGHIKEVGVELYQHMIEEAVAQARETAADPTKIAQEEWTPQISLGAPVLIPEDYVSDLGVRLSLYKRIAHLVDQEEIDTFAVELHDRFGPVPEEVKNLLDIVGLKRLCRDAGVEKVDCGPKGGIVTFHKETFENAEGLVEFIQSQAGTVKLRPDNKLVYRRDWSDMGIRQKGVRYLLQRLVEIARGKTAAQESAPG